MALILRLEGTEDRADDDLVDGFIELTTVFGNASSRESRSRSKARPSPSLLR